MLKPENFEHGINGDRIYTHRYYLNADAFAFAGLLSGDAALLEAAKNLVLEAISQQNTSGYNPEMGGHDTSYQAVGLVFAMRYYSIAASPELRQVLRPALMNGLAWLKSRVRENGSFDEAGNTRTGHGQEIGRDKKAKTMNYGAAARAFAYWSQVTKNLAFARVGAKVYSFGTNQTNNR